MALGTPQLNASDCWPHLESAKRVLSIAADGNTERARIDPVFLYTLAYGENTHILLEDRKSLERPAALEKIRLEQEAANQAAAAAVTPAPAMEDDDVVIIDATGQEPGSVLPKVKKIPLPLHFRTTFISLRPPSTFEQFLGQVKAKWVPRPSHASIEGVTFTIGTDWIIRMGFIQAGTAQKGVMLEPAYGITWDPDRIPAYADVPPTTDGQPPAILAEFVASIVPQSHADYAFLPVRFSEQQWSEVLGSADDVQSEALGAAEGVYSHGFEYATPRPSDWGTGFVQERRSAFLLLRMMLDEKLLA
ncbi:mediator complex subunit Med22 [Rhizoctonia solani]|uniref:Mediator complex subunit Med22 n=1 Tax=Rhizoctonia solani TaxID=456999 RepID=A0A8H8NNZ1_9AGAM|nr:mediator complex subunit Med22 [Rhizoctonia solani]QRW16023.1 mediator complex subunit Med22 [Rhizoctonia solani]